MGGHDLDADLEKASDSTASLPSDRSTSPDAITKEPDLTAAAAPPANTEDVLSILDQRSDGTMSSANSTHEPGRPSRPTISRSSSVFGEAVKVPRNERRGLLARFAVVAEVEEPKAFKTKTKWIITFVVAVAAAAAPMGSGIILPALKDIDRAFDTTETVANLSVAMYMLAMSIFPLWWSSFSETLGRRTIYISSFFLFCIFNILSAVSTNIAMFVVMRVLSGGASASVQAVGAGTIADIWEIKERGRAMGYFYLGPLCGPLLSPIVGGALAQGLGWRSDMWFMVIYGVLLEILLIFCLPETLKSLRSITKEAEQEVVTEVAGADEKGTEAAVRPSLSRVDTRQSVKIKTKKYGAMLRRCFLDPLAIILHLRRLEVALTVYYASITFGSLYVLNISVQQTFSAAPYNYSTIIVGLLYIPNSVGYFIASVFGGRWVDAIMHREARKRGDYDARGKLQFRPQDRLRENAWIAAFLFPSALLWYGWTAEYGVMVVAPMIANFFFGIGTMLLFAAVTTMLTEFMPKQASHGIAVNNFVRNIFSCVGGIVASPIINAIGNGWLFTILAIWAFISGVVVITSLRKYGEKWRQNALRRESEEE